MPDNVQVQDLEAVQGDTPPPETEDAQLVQDAPPASPPAPVPPELVDAVTERIRHDLRRTQGSVDRAMAEIQRLAAQMQSKPSSQQDPALRDELEMLREMVATVVPEDTLGGLRQRQQERRRERELQQRIDDLQRRVEQPPQTAPTQPQVDQELAQAMATAQAQVTTYARAKGVDLTRLSQEDRQALTNGVPQSADALLDGSMLVALERNIDALVAGRQSPREAERTDQQAATRQQVRQQTSMPTARNTGGNSRRFSTQREAESAFLNGKATADDVNWAIANLPY